MNRSQLVQFSERLRVDRDRIELKIVRPFKRNSQLKRKITTKQFLAHYIFLTQQFNKICFKVSLDSDIGITNQKLTTMSRLQSRNRFLLCIQQAITKRYMERATYAWENFYEDEEN